MSKKLYQDLPEAEREAMLEANCYHTETAPVKEHFEESEMQKMRTQFFDNALVVRKAIEALNAAKEIYKKAVAQPTKDNEYLRECLRHGYVEVNKQVYLFPDHDNGVMETFDPRGNFISSRNLTPSERQTRIS